MSCPSVFKLPDSGWPTPIFKVSGLRWQPATSPIDAATASAITAPTTPLRAVFDSSMIPTPSRASIGRAPIRGVT